MKKIILCLCLLTSIGAIRAQQLTLPPSGDNQKSRVTQHMGLVEVTVDYNSPNVHGPNGEDRKGKIWGELVHYGFADQGFGTSKAAPWRAGANENTTITFSHDVKIEGKDLKAGTYGLFLAVKAEGSWTWIFSKNSKSWGSYFYNEQEDALRVDVQPQESPYTEFLTYNFEDRELKSTVLTLSWEEKKVPMKIEVPDIHELYLAGLRNELRSSPGFNYQTWQAAAQYCAQNKINLEEALQWADNAISLPFIGQENFGTLQAKAMVLNAMGKGDEADQVMQKAITLPDASVQAVHQYGRTLLGIGKTDKAMAVFKKNRELHPKDQFTTYVGLARGYAAVGDKKNAIKNWEIAIKNLPADQKQNLAVYEGELKKLKG